MKRQVIGREKISVNISMIKGFIFRIQEESKQFNQYEQGLQETLHNRR
jgi:hypothetical protein